MKNLLNKVLIKLNYFFLFECLFLGFILLMSTPYFYSLSKTEKTVIKVQNKEVSVKNQSSLFLIFTENETFEVRDSLFTMNFKSSDDYNKIKINSCYEVHLRGLRIGFLSMFRNIEKYHEITCPEVKL